MSLVSRFGPGGVSVAPPELAQMAQRDESAAIALEDEVAALEADVAAVPVASSGPRNEVTGEFYRGKNVMRLLIAESAGGYDASRGWAGFKQWLSVGRVVRKGEHGTVIVRVFGPGKDEPGDADAPDNKTRRSGRGGVSGARVFHYDQTTELEGSK